MDSFDDNVYIFDGAEYSEEMREIVLSCQPRVTVTSCFVYNCLVKH